MFHLSWIFGNFFSLSWRLRNLKMFGILITAAVKCQLSGCMIATGQEEEERLSKLLMRSNCSETHQLDATLILNTGGERSFRSAILFSSNFNTLDTCTNPAFGCMCTTQPTHYCRWMGQKKYETYLENYHWSLYIKTLYEYMNKRIDWLIELKTNIRELIKRSR